MLLLPALCLSVSCFSLRDLPASPIALSRSFSFFFDLFERLQAAYKKKFNNLFEKSSRNILIIIYFSQTQIMKRFLYSYKNQFMVDVSSIVKNMKSSFNIKILKDNIKKLIYIFDSDLVWRMQLIINKG